MKQKDVFALLQRYGAEKGTENVLYRLAEEQDQLEKTVREMALAFEQLATVITMHNTVADAMKERLDGMAKHFDVDPRATHAVVRSMGKDDE